jgi:hypothetical protein
MTTRASSGPTGVTKNTSDSGRGSRAGARLPRPYIARLAHLSTADFAAKCGMTMRMARRIREKTK